MQGVPVQSLVKELRCHMPCGRKLKIKKINFWLLLALIYFKKKLSFFCLLGQKHGCFEFSRSYCHRLWRHQASQVALVVKNPSANAGDIEMWVWSLGQEDPLKEDMATHSSILAWRIPWTEEPGRLWYIGSQGVRHDWSDLARMDTWSTLEVWCPAIKPCNIIRKWLHLNL